jgi:hypothetical protein
MPQLRKAPSFLTGDGRVLPLLRERRFEWSCPACGVYGVVEASDGVDSSLEAIKLHHDLVSPDCANFRHVLDAAS